MADEPTFEACLAPVPDNLPDRLQPCCREKDHEGDHAFWFAAVVGDFDDMPGRNVAFWAYGSGGAALVHADLTNDGKPMDSLEAAALMWLLDRRNRP